MLLLQQNHKVGTLNPKISTAMETFRDGALFHDGKLVQH